MTTINKFWWEFYQNLQTLYDANESRAITDLVFTEILRMQSHQIHLSSGEFLTDEQYKRLEEVMFRLLVYEPVQYVLNKAWFLNEAYYVDPSVLIPRPETEELVMWAMENIRSAETNRGRNRKFTVLEIGTGSGCIAITIKKHLKDIHMIALDISEDALKVAERNAQKHQVDIDFLKMDFTRGENWAVLPEVDMIVSNPPYIPISRKKEIAQNVRDYEPEIALFIENPVLMYEKMLQFALRKNTGQTIIMAEMDPGISRKIEQLVYSYPVRDFEVRKDLNNKERMFKLIVDNVDADCG